MSREAYGGGGQYGGGSSSAGTSGGRGDGDNAREQYSAARTQAPRTQSVSVTRDGGGQVVTEDPYVMVGGQRYAVGDPAIEEAQNVVEKKNLLQKTIDLYQKYSPLGILSNLFTGTGTTGTFDFGGTGGGDGDNRQVMNQLAPFAPYAITDTTPQESVANQYFQSLGMSNQPLSSNLQTDYNNAKTTINSLLGNIPSPSQQFGYGILNNQGFNNQAYADYLRRIGLL